MRQGDHPPLAHCDLWSPGARAAAAQPFLRHQLVASRLALLCDGPCEFLGREEKVHTAQASCPSICWGVTLWVSTATDAMSQGQSDNTYAERSADFVAKGTDIQPRNSGVGDIHEFVQDMCVL